MMNTYKTGARSGKPRAKRWQTDWKHRYFCPWCGIPVGTGFNNPLYEYAGTPYHPKCLIEKLLDGANSFQTACLEWSKATFGEHIRGIGPMNHLREEVDEVIDAIGNGATRDELLEEYADCYLLLFDSAGREGFTFSEVLEAARAKHEKNKRREWGPVGEDGVSRHVAEG